MVAGESAASGVAERRVSNVASWTPSLAPAGFEHLLFEAESLGADHFGPTMPGVRDRERPEPLFSCVLPPGPVVVREAHAELPILSPMLHVVVDREGDTGGAPPVPK